MENKPSRLRGTITARNFHYLSTHVDLTVRDTRNRLLTVQHRYASPEIRSNMFGTLGIGMAIEFYIEGRFDPLKMFYKGIGVITILDPLELSPDWEGVNGDLFPNDEPLGESWDFGVEDVQRIHALLDHAKIRIREEFDPTPEAMKDVEERLGRLARKASETTAFDWKRLFVTAIVGVAIDLGFGGTVPYTLINLFKNVFSEFIRHRLLLTDGTQENR